MNFRQLEYIQVIYREGSISAAARQLYISQSALSQQLLKLEEEIGAPIFERGVTPIKLTHLGMQYMEYVNRILFEYEEANHLLKNMETAKKGRLVVGIPANRSIQLLPSLLPKFINQYPNIEIVMREFSSYELDDMLLRGEIDFSVMVSASPSMMLSFSPLIDEEIFLAVPHISPINEQMGSQTHIIDLSCFRNERFILMKKGHRLHSIAKTLFQQYDFEPNVLLETGNVDLAHRIAASGAGVCFVSRLATTLAPPTRPPRYYSLGENGLFWTLGISCHKDKYITQAMKLFFTMVKVEIQQILSAGSSQ